MLLGSYKFGDIPVLKQSEKINFSYRRLRFRSLQVYQNESFLAVLGREQLFG